MTLYELGFVNLNVNRYPQLKTAEEIVLRMRKENMVPQ